MHKDFSDDAWADYTYWIMQDKKTLKKINQEIYDVFAREILKIAADSSTNSTFNLDYVGYVNNNTYYLW